MRSLKNLPGIVEPALQRNHVATDVLVLLADTVTYHLRGVRKPRHRHWPTRPPPQGSGQRRAGSSPTYAHRKVAPPKTSPAEPSPGHGPSDQVGLLRRVDDEDAGLASSTSMREY